MTTSVLDKIVKLLALSESSNANEAAAALAAANKLMFEHRIEMADVDKERGKAEGFQVLEVMRGKRMEGWKLHLAAALAEYNGCVLVSQRSAGEKVRVFVGERAVIDCTSAMFSHACIEISRLATKRCHGLGKRAFNSFSHGAVQGIRDRLREQAKANRQTATSTALATLDAETGEIIKFLAQKGCKKRVHGAPKVDDLLFQQGYIRGRQIGLEGKSLNQGQADV